MTQDEKRSFIPQELYANAYLEIWTDILGKKHEDFSFGNTQLILNFSILSGPH